jgi:hypothetical protein
MTKRIGFILFCIGISFAAGAQDAVYSRLWGKNGELWKKKKLPDFTHAGYKEGKLPIPSYPVKINLVDFGGKGDGITDNTIALRKAIRNCPSNGAIFIPEGIFLISDTILIKKRAISLRGSGSKTILFFTKGLEELYPNFNTQFPDQSQWSWSGAMIRFDGDTHDCGIEQLTIKFPDRIWEGHNYHEPGYNAVGFAGKASNCWLTNIDIVGCDMGIWIDSAAHHITAQYWNLKLGALRKTKDLTGHHGVNCYGGYNLLQYFSLEGKFQHDLSVESTKSKFNVFRQGSGLDLSIDHHNHGQSSNLFTALDMGQGTRPYFSGGIETPRGISFGETYWNLKAVKEMPLPDQYNDKEKSSARNIAVGIKTNQKSVLGDNLGNWFENIDPKLLFPADLYEAQLNRRKNNSYPGAVAPLIAWTSISARAKDNNEEAKAVRERPMWTKLYSDRKAEPLPVPLKNKASSYRSMAEKPAIERFPLMDKDWPDKVGAAVICLWEDDKLAAASVSIDDNNAQDISAWKEIDKRYGGLNLTWFLITGNIGGVVDPARLAISGTWETWEKMKQQGFHIESHSVSHVSNPVMEDGWQGPDWDMGLSKVDLDKNLKGQRTRLFAPPGSALPEFRVSMNWRPGMSKYFVAARGFSGIPINKANAIDYFDIRTTANPLNHINGDSRYVQYASILDPTNPYYRGWATVFTHGIYGADLAASNNPQTAALALVFDFFNCNRNDIWIGAITDVALYAQERDMGSVKTKAISDKEIRLALISQMDSKLFDYPLTVKVRIPETWLNLNVTQAGLPLSVKTIVHLNQRYALVKVQPNQGDISLMPVK